MDNWWEGKTKDVDPAGQGARDIPSNISMGESALRSFANTATFGMAPRISAGINTAIGKLPGMYDEPYGKRLKDYLDADKAAQEANPKTSFAAGLPAQILQAAATGGGSLVRQAGVNTAIGAVNAAGNAREGEVLKDAATGGATAGALSAVPGVMGKGIDLASKYASGKIAAPLEALLKNKPVGWEDEVARLYGQTKESLIKKEGFRSVEQAGLEMLDMIKQGGKAYDPSDAGNIRLSDVPGLPKLMEPARPSMGQLGKEAVKATAQGAVGAAGGAGLNAMLGSPVDPLSAAAAGAGWQAKGNLAKLGVEAGKRGVMRLGTSPAAENMRIFTGNNNQSLGAVNQLVSQAGAAESTPAGGFRKLSDYLKGMDENEKRKEAMKLQSSAEGRAVGNTEAPQDDWWSGKTR